MRAVYKYPIPVADCFDIMLPVGATLLSVQYQPNAGPCLWALVDPEANSEHVSFRLAGTGHPIDDKPRDYVGTFQMHGGALVSHLFRDVRP